MTTPEDAVAVLSRALEADPEAITALFRTRVECNDKLSDDPTIQVKLIPESGGRCEIGLIGIINGIFDIREDGRGYICMFNGTDGTLTHFGITPPKVLDPPPVKE